MPFGDVLRSIPSLLAAPLLGGMLAQVLGQLAPYIASGGILEQTFTAAGQYWLLVAILSLIVGVAASAVAEGGRL